MVRDLLHPLAARARDPRATHHLRLAHIQSRHPLDHLGLIGFDLHRPRLRTPPTEPGRPPVGAAGNGKSDPRARSTRNGPQHSPRRPTSERPRRPGDYDANGWPPAIFSPERGSPTGAHGTSGRVPVGAPAERRVAAGTRISPHHLILLPSPSAGELGSGV